MREKGNVVRWDDERGFGFIEGTDGGEPVFMRINAVTQRGRRPQVGDRVSYRLSQDAKGRLRADNIRYADRQGKLASIKATIGALPDIFGVLFVVLLVGLAAWGRVPWVVVIAYAAVSVIAFFTYGLDKRFARKEKRRIAESTLLLLGLLCGWPGALVAQRVFRHKTSKRSFQISFWVMVVVNVAIFGYFAGIGNFGFLSQ
ncbi:MAG: DUF1294 domain-containing protein [Halomonas sp.]|uniref:DUF1294 domain-containing protein n=1 Tax=Halomonas sp. TaxID=1486246 RepID=UPI003F90224A